uniref:Integrase catalytic domain-containing protein n=1 Tax=Lutzomyia longipalpis TaxID=7200 RepID=A0A1B0C8T1_LUTLO
MYVALFVCMTTRAIHIELVSDLTTQAFLAALRRFVSRRGCPAKILKERDEEIGATSASDERQQETQAFAVKHGIEFVFIPPRSPHFGGSWESLIKRIKHHVIRTMGNERFTQEEMLTMLAQIEGCINSRPLTPLSSDATDLSALTPGHFTALRELTAAPDEPLTDYPENRLSKWERLQQRVQFFWKRWTTEYLHTLQQRNKWTEEHPSLIIGDMVLVKEDNLPPMKWMIGRVIAVSPGEDARVRVADVRTSTGVYRRAVAKLCLLPIERDLQKHQFLPGQDGSVSR